MKRMTVSSCIKKPSENTLAVVPTDITKQDEAISSSIYPSVDTNVQCEPTTTAKNLTNRANLTTTKDSTLFNLESDAISPSDKCVNVAVTESIETEKENSEKEKH